MSDTGKMDTTDQEHGAEREARVIGIEELETDRTTLLRAVLFRLLDAARADQVDDRFLYVLHADDAPDFDGETLPGSFEASVPFYSFLLSSSPLEEVIEGGNPADFLKIKAPKAMIDETLAHDFPMRHRRVVFSFSSGFAHWDSDGVLDIPATADVFAVSRNGIHDRVNEPPVKEQVEDVDILTARMSDDWEGLDYNTTLNLIRERVDEHHKLDLALERTLNFELAPQKTASAED